MKLLFRAKLWIALVALAVLGLTVGTAYAHERRAGDDHQMVVGWIVEPAFSEQKNGVDFRVTHTDGEPMEGLEKTLQVEVTHVPSKQSKTLKLRALFNDPGHYTADLVPTATGQYRFRFFGTMHEEKVDQTFLSGPGRFGDIEAPEEVQFPEKLPGIRETASALKGAQKSAEQGQDAAEKAQDAADRAQDSASQVLFLAILGIVLGAAGLASGAVALRRR